MKSFKSFKVGVIILAAGSSRRMGQPKQLLAWGKGTLLQHIVETALKSKIGPVGVVIGASADLIYPTVQSENVHLILNEEHASGQSSSIRTAVQWAKNQSLDGILFLLGDQPHISAEAMKKLLQAAQTQVQAIKAPLVASAYGEGLGVPAIFGKYFFSQLLALTGEQGAKSVLLQNENRLEVVALPEAILDLDTPEDYERARASESPVKPSKRREMDSSV